MDMDIQIWADLVVAIGAKYLLSLYIFCVFTFQFLNDEITMNVILSFNNWKVKILSSKNIQTEQN